MSHLANATFSFVLDGKTDMMSLNPLELTNFEMMGTIFGFAGLIITYVLTRRAAVRQKPHVFTAQETDEDAIY